MKCPNCGEENPSYTQTCSCGHKLDVKKAYLKGGLSIVFVIIGVLGALIAGAIGRECAREVFRPLDLASTEGMEKLIDSLKAKHSLPVEVRDGISLFDIDFEQKSSGVFVLIYFYQLDWDIVQLQKAGLDQPTHEGIEQSTAIYCRDMAFFVQQGIGIEYEYYDRNYIFIYEFTIYPEDCSNPVP